MDFDRYHDEIVERVQTDYEMNEKKKHQITEKSHSQSVEKCIEIEIQVLQVC